MEKQVRKILKKKNSHSFTCERVILKASEKARAKIKERKASLEKVAFETINTGMLLRNLALMVPREKGKANPSSKEREKLPSMEIEEKENLVLLSEAILVPRLTHSLHVDSAIRLGIPQTVVEGD
jgi:hypothetical protein